MTASASAGDPDSSRSPHLEQHSQQSHTDFIIESLCATVRDMDEVQRLGLIGEAVKYCQRVRKLGMPENCYSKALRAPIQILWERREGKTKMAGATYRSKAAMGLGDRSSELRYDHAIAHAARLGPA
jgi:hypothetical protein